MRYKIKIWSSSIRKSSLLKKEVHLFINMKSCHFNLKIILCTVDWF